MPSRQFFIENKGQWPAEVRYLTRIGGMDAWVTNSGITYDFHTFKKPENRDGFKNNVLKENPLKENRERIGHVVAMRFKNALADIETESREEQPGRYNYLIGERSNWATDVRFFKEVSLLKVYDGIDARIYLESGLLRYDMVLKPGADPAQIAMTFDGADKILINKKGELVLKTSLGDVVQQKLFAFQNIDGKKKKVECTFAFKNGEVGFDLGKYDATKPLVIDPLIYSTYIGGVQFDNVQSIAADPDGAVYITGSTNSPNYPTTTGAKRELDAFSLDDVFVTKLSKDGRYLEYSTFLGGKGRDMGSGIVVGKDLNTYITGYTYSYEHGYNTRFPTTPTAYDTSYNSPGTGSKADGFVIKLNPQGSEIVYSTFIGGNDDDFVRAITIDKNGNSYITGETYSTDLPASATAFDRTLGSNGEPEKDVFVAKFNTLGTALTYLTYIGNTGLNTQTNPPRNARFVDDYVSGIAVDTSGNAYITGTTTSDQFPTTSGAFDRVIGLGRLDPESGSLTQGEDIYVTKLNTNGSALIYSTFVGGDSTENAGGIVVDRQGNAWITGQTYSVTTAVPSARFPVTPGAFDTVLISPTRSSSDALLVKLNSTGSQLLYSTLIGNGNSDFEYGNAIAIDSLGSVYIAGQTNSPDFPVSAGLAEDKTYNGGNDAFIMKFRDTGGSLPIYSSYLGGSDSDIGRSIAVDTARDSYIAGTTLSSNFPFKNYIKTYDSTYSSSPQTTDGFISKFRMECSLVVDAGHDTVLCPGDSVLIGNRVGAGTGLAPFRYKFTPSTGLSNDSNFSVVARPLVTTEYTLTVTDRIGCVVTDKIKVSINPAIIADAGKDIETCSGKDTVIGKEATGGTGVFKYKWTPSTGLSSDTVARPRLTPTVSQQYTVVVTDSRGCTASDVVDIIITTPVSFTSTAPAAGLDFGSLSACQKDDSLTFTITNTSGRIVKITGYVLSNSAFKVTTPAAGFNLSADPSRADAKKTLTVKFSPQSAGTFKDSLQLVTSPCGELYTIRLTGKKLESLVKADTNIYNFGKSYTCQAATARDTNIIVRNSGTGDITIQAPSVPAPYSLIDPPTAQFPKVLKSGEFLVLKVQLTPPAAEGPANAILEVPYQSAACPASSIAIDLISERVRTGADISFKNITLPDITGCDTYRDTVIVFKNTGTESITIESMDPANGLQLLGTLPLTIQPGETDSVRVRYAPDATTTSLQATFTFGPCSEKLVATLTGSRKGISFQLPASIQADTVVLCRGTSSTGTASITNKSGVDVKLREDAVVTGPFSVNNTLLKGLTFKNGIPQNFTYTFTSAVAGTFTGTLTLKFDLCDFDTTILLKATASEATISAQNTLAMGVVAVGGFKEDSIEVKNTGTAPVTIAQLSGISAPFSIISPNPGFIIQPNTSVFVRIRFDAAVAGVFKDTLITTSTNPCDILLKTEITAGETSVPNYIGKAQITIGRDTSASGTTVKIPLRIQSSENLVQSNTKNYTAVISFNKNLLKPTGSTPQGTINGSLRTISVSGTRGDTLGILKELEFIALLGDAACTDITIDSFVWTDGNATATTSNGQFCVSELCQAGGSTRLISSGGGQFMLMQNKPNPAGEETEIEYTLTEPGLTTLTITDMLGRTVKTLVNENAAAGRYSVTLNTIDIPSGLYMYILKTPTQATTQSMQVMK
ncbi:MAG: SBBP repeat-containing protein [Bacteroidota bacterium]